MTQLLLAGQSPPYRLPAVAHHLLPPLSKGLDESMTIDAISYPQNRDAKFFHQ